MGTYPALARTLSPMLRRCAPILLALLAACSSEKAPLATERLAPCAPEKELPGAFCGRYEVFEDSAAGAGRKIPLQIVLLPALANDPAPDPIFLLAGGPGQGAADIAGQLDDFLAPLRRRRDIVLVDQRGTGESAPLECDFEEGEREFTSIEVPRQLIEACLASYEGDTRLYVTPIAMDDLDEVREWLGYDRINLYGGSYGTRAALVYLRRHPDSVRSLTLDGVAPPDMALPLYFARDAQRALDKLLEACEADDACNARFPGLRQKTNELLSSLEGAPREVRYRHPRTGQWEEGTITQQLVALSLTGMLYSPWLSALAPLLVEQALAGYFEPLLALAASSEQIAESMSQGMFYSVVCSEDWPLIDERAIELETEGTFLGRSLFETRWAPCRYWPQAQLPPEYYEPVESDVPALILSGEVDPVTPPSWGERVAEHLPNSRHIVAPATGHGVLGTGCGRSLLEEFVETADAAALDASCLDELRRPPFFLTPAAPIAPEDPRP